LSLSDKKNYKSNKNLFLQKIIPKSFASKRLNQKKSLNFSPFILTCFANKLV
jgi:hypothetical protein